MVFSSLLIALMAFLKVASSSSNSSFPAEGKGNWGSFENLNVAGTCKECQVKKALVTKVLASFATDEQMADGATESTCVYVNLATPMVSETNAPAPHTLTPHIVVELHFLIQTL
ncbi:hypothetical protein CEXT_501081 [Caerostris extrusa]|uniref:Uncharacterized protein n=1 Tax=Caerostris extrusa TaxID=172846 RepID=A0AAV4QGI1_CAEEX|nr:hypothetical protein CEXT_364871 [Caerostris extrusa]GIZ03216.1 hypothetical protein CEXT_501081 [Caerostris extrusa]